MTGEWGDWIGREERSADTCSTGFARRWLGTFDLPQDLGAPLPHSVHWCLAVPDMPSARLGPDGHPARDGGGDSFLPPVPLERRMWAGSACEFLEPIAIGAEVGRISRVAGIEQKDGRSGPLVFVTIAHEWRSDGVPAVRETQSLVYRQAPTGDAPPPRRDAFDPADWDAAATYRPDAPLMFRYSALTFNTHRIHYDADYVRDVEGYPGLVVHGPLTATQLLLLAQSHFGPQALADFSFRALSPAFAGEEIALVLRQEDDRIAFAAFADPAGGTARRIMEASGTQAR